MIQINKEKLDVPIWILTYKRTDCLNRLIHQFIDEGFTNINILSSHSTLEVEEDILNLGVLKNVVINTLNDDDSNAWCARNWNTCFLKALKTHDSVMCVQDDTTVNRGFGKWFLDASDKYDFLWGPAGDQWFYLTREVLATVGFWDERFLSCWCGDMDMVRRVYWKYDQNKISIEDSHAYWGFVHNPSGITQMVNQGDVRPWLTTKHVNQHHEMEAKGIDKPILLYCMSFYKQKWGKDVWTKINTSPAKNLIEEIDWYPWFTRNYMFRPDKAPQYEKMDGKWIDRPGGKIYVPLIKDEFGNVKELENWKKIIGPCDNCGD